MTEEKSCKNCRGCISSSIRDICPVLNYKYWEPKVEIKCNKCKHFVNVRPAEYFCCWNDDKKKECIKNDFKFFESKEEQKLCKTCKSYTHIGFFNDIMNYKCAQLPEDEIKCKNNDHKFWKPIPRICANCKSSGIGKNRKDSKCLDCDPKIHTNWETDRDNVEEFTGTIIVLNNKKVSNLPELFNDSEFGKKTIVEVERLKNSKKTTSNKKINEDNVCRNCKEGMLYNGNPPAMLCGIDNTYHGLLSTCNNYKCSFINEDCKMTNCDVYRENIHAKPDICSKCICNPKVKEYIKKYQNFYRMNSRSGSNEIRDYHCKYHHPYECDNYTGNMCKFLVNASYYKHPECMFDKRVCPIIVMDEENDKLRIENALLNPNHRFVVENPKILGMNELCNMTNDLLSNENKSHLVRKIIQSWHVHEIDEIQVKVLLEKLYSIRD